MTSASHRAATPTARLRGALLAGCALWIAASANVAHAQAFDSSPIVRGGSVTITRTPGNDLITVQSNSAVIDWVRPLGTANPLVFLPAGNVATFQNGANNANFAVLNRIFSNVPVQFDGTVISQLRNSAGTASIGGTVLFASPAGIIIGSTAVFDVGSLVLTTLDVANDLAQEGPGNFIDPTGAIDFSGGSAFPDAAIVTLPGSQIRALNEGSFVAMVAPRLLVGGSVRVNGSAGYVAAEAALVRINAGLFDIIVNAGSNNPNPIIHAGSTGGPASSGAGDNHRIYLVTAAQTQAVNALLGGTIGFDDATSATVENGAIILSSGFNVYGDTVDRYGDLPAGVPASDIAASFQIVSGTITSNLFGFAQTDALAGGTSSLQFSGNVALFGGDRAQLYAGVGGTTTVQGSAFVSAARFDSVNDVSALTGGDARLYALAGGTLTIAGDATVDASARGQINSDFVGGSGTGGNALVSADGGTVSVGGALSVRATGEGPAGFSFASLEPVDGIGGSAAVEALNGGQVVAGGNLRIDASGLGSAFNRSDGIGGTARLSAASGGTVTGGNATLVAAGVGGNNGAGAGQGGTVQLTATEGEVVLTGAVDLDASGQGGSAAGSGETGADGRGGTVQVLASNGAVASRIAAGSLGIDVRGTGGAGGPPDESSGGTGPGGAGGNGFGGSATAFAESGNGVLDLGPVTIAAQGIGGDGDTGAAGGSGTGGTIAAGTIAGSVPAGSAGTARFGTLDFNASGVGGTLGGAGRGGSVTFAASGGQVIQAGAAQLLADGIAGGPGALALGGFVTTGADGGGTLTSGDVTGRVNAVGGGAGSTAGRWRVYANGGNATYANLTLGASGGVLLPATSLIEPANGTINILGTAALSSQGSITLSASGSGRTIGGAIGLTAGDDVLFTHVGPTGATIDAASLTVLAGDDFNAAAGVVTRTSARTEIRAADQASIAGQIGGRDILVTGNGIDIAAGGSVGDSTSLTTTLQAVGTAQVSGNVRGGAILVTATDILLTAGGGIGDGATTQTRLQATNLASLSGQVLGVDILVQAARISVTPTGVVGGAATGPSELRATGAVDIAGLLLGRNITVSGSRVALATSGAIGNGATLGVIVRTPGLAALSGSVRGGDILIDAGQIDVATTGSVGDAATIRNELRATGAVDVAGSLLGRALVIGGAGVNLAATGTIGASASTTSVGIDATNSIFIAGAIRGADIRAAAPNINLVAGGTVGDGSSTLVRLLAGNAATVAGQVLGADIRIQSASFLVSGAVGDASSLNVVVNGSAAGTISGSVLGRAIAIGAAGLNLTATSRIGTSGSTASVGIDATSGALLAGAIRGADIRVTAPIINLPAGGTVGDGTSTQVRLLAGNTNTVAGQVLGGDIRLQGSTILLSGAVGDAASRNVALVATGNATISGNLLGQAITVGAGALDLTAAGRIGASGSTASVGIDATTSALLAGAIRGTDIRVAAPTINLPAGGSVGDGTSALVRLLAANNATVAGQVLGADIRVQGGTTLISGAVGDAASRNVLVSAAGNATVSGSVLGSAIAVTGAQVIVTAPGIVGGPQTATTQVRAIGDATVAGRVLGTNIVVGGTNVILAAGGAIGGTGTDAVSLLAVDDANIAGAVRGRNITIGSADIDIAATGSVGDANTELVLLAVNGGGPPLSTATASLDTSAILAPNQFTVLGGTTDGPGYTLGNAEAGRIRAGILRVVAPTLSAAANRAPDVLIRDLSFNGGGATAGIGRFELTTPGIVRVEGALSMAGARPTDGMALDASQRLEVSTTTGSVRVRDVAGNPAGTLTLTSANLWIASTGLIDRLRADPFYAGRDQDLFESDGVPLPRGFVEANGVTLVTGGTLFVQNSGNFVQFGGVTTGPPGLLIRSTVPGASVTAFGRRRNADGSFTSGQLLFFETGFAAPGNGPRSAGFTAESTFNTCRIVSGLCPGATPNPLAPGRDPTIGPTGGSDLVQLPPGVPNDDLVDTSFSAEGLIEEPVTSGGESLLWTEKCEPDENGRCEEVNP